MKIFTRRNAIVGFLALRALRRARRNATVGYLAAQSVEHTRARRRGGRALRLTLYATLALFSLGVLAAALHFARRQSSASEELLMESEEVEEAVAGAGDAGAEAVEDATSELDGAYSMEPAPAT